MQPVPPPNSATPRLQAPALSSPGLSSGPPVSLRDQLSLSKEARSGDPLAHFRKTVERVTSGGLEGWTATDGLCIDLSAKWRTALASSGIKTDLVIVNPGDTASSATTLDGRRAHGKTHAFLIFQHAGEEYIFDPTIQQFFSGGATTVPPIFIGTRDDLASVFTREQERLQIEIEMDRNHGRHDPLAFAELIYGFGPYAPLRVTIDD
jgi:hypothetical protein